jgi:hypothetical protein
MSESWQVTGQRQSSVRGPSGSFEDAMIVSYKTKHGTEASITVPMSQYHPDHVHGLIEAQAALVDRVNSLSGAESPSLSSPSRHSD